EGSYGHPDHVHAHHVTVAACEAAGTTMIEIASDPESTGFSWREQRDSLAAVEEALRAYRTQLTVLGVEEAGLDHAGRIRIRHVGGQDDAIDMRTGLRLRQVRPAGSADDPRRRPAARRRLDGCWCRCRP